MKKPYLYQRLCVVLLLLLCAFAINSCKKDQHAVSDNNPAVEEAKAWYNALYPKQATGKQINTISGDIDFSQLTSPDWDQSKTYTRLGDEVIEMPLDPGSPLGMGLKDMAGKQTPYTPSHSRSSFIILKKGDSYQAYIMTIIADSAYLKGDLGKLNNNRYNKRDSDFTGAVLYFTPKGKIVSGWFYKQGAMQSKLNTNPAEAAAHSASLQKQASAYRSNTLVMVTTCSDWYYYVTTPVGVGDMKYGGTVCTNRYYNTGGGSGSGTGSGTGGGGAPGGSGNEGDPNPCKTLLAYKAANAYHTTGNPTPKPPGGYDGDDDDGFPPPTSPTEPSNPCPPVGANSTCSQQMCRDTSIINDRLLNCLFDLLDGKNKVFDSLAAAYKTSNNMDLRFTKSNNLPTNGATDFNGMSYTNGKYTGVATVNLSASYVKDNMGVAYIDIARTVFHETWHAELFQKVYSTYHTIDLAKIQQQHNGKEIKDMTTAELIDLLNVDQNGMLNNGGQPVQAINWDNLEQHNYMAKHIDIMAAGLGEFLSDINSPLKDNKEFLYAEALSTLYQGSTYFASHLSEFATKFPNSPLNADLTLLSSYINNVYLQNKTNTSNLPCNP